MMSGVLIYLFNQLGNWDEKTLLCLQESVREKDSGEGRVLRRWLLEQLGMIKMGEEESCDVSLNGRSSRHKGQVVRIGTLG